MSNKVEFYVCNVRRTPWHATYPDVEGQRTAKYLEFRGGEELRRDLNSLERAFPIGEQVEYKEGRNTRIFETTQVVGYESKPARHEGRRVYYIKLSNGKEIEYNIKGRHLISLARFYRVNDGPNNTYLLISPRRHQVLKRMMSSSQDTNHDQHILSTTRAPHPAERLLAIHTVDRSTNLAPVVGHLDPLSPFNTTTIVTDPLNRGVDPITLTTGGKPNDDAIAEFARRFRNLDTPIASSSELVGATGLTNQVACFGQVAVSNGRNATTQVRKASPAPKPARSNLKENEVSIEVLPVNTNSLNVIFENRSGPKGATYGDPLPKNEGLYWPVGKLKPLEVEFLGADKSSVGSEQIQKDCVFLKGVNEEYGHQIFYLRRERHGEHDTRRYPLEKPMLFCIECHPVEHRVIFTYVLLIANTGEAISVDTTKKLPVKHSPKATIEQRVAPGKGETSDLIAHFRIAYGPQLKVLPSVYLSAADENLQTVFPVGSEVDFKERPDGNVEKVKILRYEVRQREEEWTDRYVVFEKGTSGTDEIHLGKWKQAGNRVQRKARADFSYVERTDFNENGPGFTYSLTEHKTRKTLSIDTKQPHRLKQPEIIGVGNKKRDTSGCDFMWEQYTLTLGNLSEAFKVGDEVTLIKTFGQEPERKVVLKVDQDGSATPRKDYIELGDFGAKAENSERIFFREPVNHKHYKPINGARLSTRKHPTLDGYSCKLEFKDGMVVEVKKDKKPEFKDTFVKADWERKVEINDHDTTI